MYFVHACGVRVVTLDHGPLGICKSSVCTWNRGPLCPLLSRFVLFFFLVSERSGRLPPPAERSAALYWSVYLLVLVFDTAVDYLHTYQYDTRNYLLDFPKNA